jgi:type I restriction enzyme S subunit
MMGEWRSSTWGEEVSLEYGKSLRGYDAAKGQYRVFGSNGPIGWTAQPLAPGPGVILGRKGAYRGVQYSSEPFFVIDTAYYVVPKTELDMRWLYYAIKHYKLGEVDDGSPIPSTTRAAVYVMDLEVPPIDEQRAIAHILGTLDDKIELNRKMNQTLEAMARAIFKSWFVDFDPVRAKADGRDPGLPRDLAALFPDSFEDSELGEIPKGWKMMQLGDLIELAYGKALKEENRQPGNIPVFGSNGQVGIHDEKLVSGPGIVVGRKGNPGIVTWSPSDFFAIDTTFYVVTKDTCRSLLFLFYALQDLNLASQGSDSAVPGLNRNMAYMGHLVVPSALLLDAFDKRIKPFFERINHNNGESHTLAALRDALLPKLLSGEIRVKDAERIAGRCA